MDKQKLLEELETGNERQRRIAAYKLSKLKDPDTVPYLMKACNDPDAPVRRDAAIGLRNIGTPEALDFLNSLEARKEKAAEEKEQQFLDDLGIKAKTPHHPVWEYLTLTAAHAGGDYLGIVKMVNNQKLANWKQRNWGVFYALQWLGEEGWELVNVMWRKTGEVHYADPVYYLKRRVE